jgi:hypothetical protein
MQTYCQSVKAAACFGSHRVKIAVNVMIAYFLRFQYFIIIYINTSIPVVYLMKF